jgi:hypothetical protein
MSKEDKKDLKEHLKSTNVKQTVENKIGSVDENIKSGITNVEPLEKIAEKTALKDNTNFEAYSNAIKILDKEYHQFEHNFFPNVNKYPSSLLDEKIAETNNPEMAHYDQKVIQNPSKQYLEGTDKKDEKNKQ